MVVSRVDLLMDGLEALGSDWMCIALGFLFLLFAFPSLAVVMMLARSFGRFWVFTFDMEFAWAHDRSRVTF